MTSNDQDKRQHDDNDLVLKAGEESLDAPAETFESLEIKNASAKSGQGDAKGKAKQQAEKKAEAPKGPVLFDKSYMEDDPTNATGATRWVIVILFTIALLLVAWKSYLYNKNSGNNEQRATKERVLDKYRQNLERQLQMAKPTR